MKHYQFSTQYVKGIVLLQSSLCVPTLSKPTKDVDVPTYGWLLNLNTFLLHTKICVSYRVLKNYQVLKAGIKSLVRFITMLIGSLIRQYLV